jgi:hypothetical protein
MIEEISLLCKKKLVYFGIIASHAPPALSVVSGEAIVNLREANGEAGGHLCT